MSGLTPKQQRFVEEYVVDFNGKQAAIRAGYSEASAESQASRLLRNDKVSEAVEERREDVSERVALTQEWVLGELQDIARACKKTMPAVAKAALELLGKHTGLWSDSGGKQPEAPVEEPVSDNPHLSAKVLAFKQRKAS